MKKLLYGFAIVVLGALLFWGGRESAPKNGAEAMNGSGRVVFAVTDAAASLGNIDSLILKVSEVRVKSQTEGWVTVSEEIHQFDLLRLKETNALALLVDANIKPGTYEQVRLTIDEVLVIQGNKSLRAKLPSNDLKIVGKIVVEADKTATVLLDFLADKSLHVTGSGGFIFSPVIKLETRSDAAVTVSARNVDISGGTIETSTEVGMTESGETREGFRLEPDASLEIVNDVIRIIPKGEDEGVVAVTASAAINTVIAADQLDTVITVKLTTFEGKKVWRVSGVKGIEVVHVFVDVTTGNIVGNE